MPTWLASLFSGVGAGLLAWGARRLRFGRAENEQIVAEAARQAVRTIQGSLDYLRLEREELRTRVGELERRNEELSRAKSAQGGEIIKLRRRIAELEEGMKSGTTT